MVDLACSTAPLHSPPQLMRNMSISPARFLWGLLTVHGRHGSSSKNERSLEEHALAPSGFDLWNRRSIQPTPSRIHPHLSDLGQPHQKKHVFHGVSQLFNLHPSCSRTLQGTSMVNGNSCTRGQPDGASPEPEPKWLGGADGSATCSHCIGLGVITCAVGRSVKYQNIARVAGLGAFGV